MADLKMAIKNKDGESINKLLFNPAALYTPSYLTEAFLWTIEFDNLEVLKRLDYVSFSKEIIEQAKKVAKENQYRLILDYLDTLKVCKIKE